MPEFGFSVLLCQNVILVSLLFILIPTPFIIFKFFIIVCLLFVYVFNHIIYRIEGNIGGGKCWRIWRMTINSPKFPQPTFMLAQNLLSIILTLKGMKLKCACLTA